MAVETGGCGGCGCSGAVAVAEEPLAGRIWIWMFSDVWVEILGWTKAGGAEEPSGRTIAD